MLALSAEALLLGLLLITLLNLECHLPSQPQPLNLQPIAYTPHLTTHRPGKPILLLPL